MLYSEYETHFKQGRARFSFPSAAQHWGRGCETEARPEMPPWMMDWAVVYPDNMFFRSKSYIAPSLPPGNPMAEESCLVITMVQKPGQIPSGMPRTMNNDDTIIRVDLEPRGLHLHYGKRNHLRQSDITGNFRLDDAEAFSFIRAVELFRRDGQAFHETLGFAFRGETA